MIDESHNLRNREGKRYRAIQEYIQENESQCIFLSATPYNKTYLDLSNQLRLFVAEDKDLGIRPEQLLRKLGETEFIRRYQCSVRSLAAFERSEYADDWRELMRLYLVRRTRSFIQEHYAETDSTNWAQVSALRRRDASTLQKILAQCGEWDASKDTKLDALLTLITEKHPHEKILVFTQFADTVRYLETQLKARGISELTGVTGIHPIPLL